jgi:NAD(P)-dependent dehydrogenase (short-subunit alcohol dehydrogenase family)
LLTAGAEVIMAVRDVARGERVAQELRSSTTNERAHVLGVDLGALTSVRQAAVQIRARWPKLDLLINNAGIMATPQEFTPDGFESQLGTNHLGHYLLTRLLVPPLQAAAPARVIVLSSSAHRRSDVYFEDLNYRHRPYERWEAYGQSKTANALFAVGLTQHMSIEGITANAVNPGGTHTGLLRHLTPRDLRDLGWIDQGGRDTSHFKTPEEGAATSVWAAIGEELTGVGGRYLENCQEATPYDRADERGDLPFHGYMPYALDPDHAERLWNVSQELVGRQL